MSDEFEFSDDDEEFEEREVCAREESVACRPIWRQSGRRSPRRRSRRTFRCECLILCEHGVARSAIKAVRGY